MIVFACLCLPFFLDSLYIVYGLVIASSTFILPVRYNIGTSPAGEASDAVKTVADNPTEVPVTDQCAGKQEQPRKCSGAAVYSL